MEHQESVHQDATRFIGNFGGYGTGKTTTSRQEVYKHCFITPNANVLIGAKVTSQYEQTIKREIEADIPREFVKAYSAQKSYMDLVNGARIMYRPLEDPDKLRSYNLTMFVIIEASEVPADAFHQLKTRLRNTNAEYWRKGIIESNPDSGWVRTDVLLTSHDIQTYGDVLDSYQVHPDAKDLNVASHIAATNVNKYLPANFVDELIKNKPAWWCSRYIYGSFSYSEGLVYPDAARSVVKAFRPPKGWLRILACDYGLSDNFVYIKAAIDPMEGICYVYDEYVTNNRNVDELAEAFFKFTADIVAGGWYTPPIIDPKNAPKRDYQKKSLYDHFLERGIYFQPGHVSLEGRIFRLNTYFVSGRMRIMDNCPVTIKEFEQYKFPDKSLTKSTRAADKPVDKNNHCINPVEWIAMALPADPKKLGLGVYDARGIDITVDSPHNKPKDTFDPFFEPKEDTEIFSLGGIPW